jgi:hypothetical protein
MDKKRVLAAAVATVLCGGIAMSNANLLFAAENPTPTAAAPSGQAAPSDQKESKAAQSDLIQVSDDAFTTMRNVGAARLAIFNGRPEQAQTFVDAAVTRSEASIKDAEKYILDTHESTSDDLYVPFDANLTVSETFSLNEQNKEHLAKANEHLRNGQKKEALEDLKLGDMDTIVAAKLVPMKYAKEHIDEAAKLMGEGKYYEANLALKAVEDAVVVETFALDSTPGANSKG